MVVWWRVWCSKRLECSAGIGVCMSTQRTVVRLPQYQWRVSSVSARVYSVAVQSAAVPIDGVHEQGLYCPPYLSTIT